MPVPADVAALNVLDRVDYKDAFAIDTSGSRTAEQWARRCFEVDPPQMLRTARLILERFGAHAEQPELAGIAGLTILRNEPEQVVLGFAVNFGTPRIIFSAMPGRLVMTTLIRFDASSGPLMWAAIGWLHRITARALVDRAAHVTA
ncbi:MAG: hypothetical protein P4L86_29545 [Mycobacterium sp.]|nr:hypothetical protein [Mycobacterium sp.]